MVLIDEQWQTIERLLPGKPGDRGRSFRDSHLFVEPCCGWRARVACGGIFPRNSASGIRSRCTMCVGVMQASGIGSRLHWLANVIWRGSSSTRLSFVRTTTLPAPQISNAASAAAPARRFGDQVEFRRRSLEQTVAHDSEHRPSCRQRIRSRRFGPAHRSVRRAANHPAALQPHHAQAR